MESRGGGGDREDGGERVVMVRTDLGMMEQEVDVEGAAKDVARPGEDEEAKMGVVEAGDEVWVAGAAAASGGRRRH